MSCPSACEAGASTSILPSSQLTHPTTARCDFPGWQPPRPAAAPAPRRSTSRQPSALLRPTRPPMRSTSQHDFRAISMPVGGNAAPWARLRELRGGQAVAGTGTESQPPQEDSTAPATTGAITAAGRALDTSGVGCAVASSYGRDYTARPLPPQCPHPVPGYVQRTGAHASCRKLYMSRLRAG
jgi:hypothetical protein